MANKEHNQISENGLSSQISVSPSPSDHPQTKRPGPRTVEGKAIASKNATKHGIFANAVVLKSESRQEYNVLLDGLRRYFKPEGTLEQVLVEKLAILSWRYRRLIAAETDELNSDGLIADLDFKSRAANLIRLPSYETTIERAFDRTLNQLERYQRMRLGQPVAPPLRLEVSS
jgi:hypothetical protein